MRTVFARLAGADPRADPVLASLLARAYKFKEVADYGVGARGVVTPEEAREAIGMAERFVGAITHLLPPGDAAQV